MFGSVSLQFKSVESISSIKTTFSFDSVLACGFYLVMLFDQRDDFELTFDKYLFGNGLLLMPVNSNQGDCCFCILLKKLASFLRILS